MTGHFYFGSLSPPLFNIRPFFCSLQPSTWPHRQIIISLILCANLSLQHLPAPCMRSTDRLDLFSLLLRTFDCPAACSQCRAFGVIDPPPLGLASLPYYVMSGISMHYTCILSLCYDKFSFLLMGL